MNGFNLRAGLLAAALGISSSAWAQVSVQPAAPRLLETVHVLAPPSAFTGEYSFAGLSMAGNSITIAVQYPVAPYGAPILPLDTVVGQLPAGDYDVKVTALAPDGVGSTTVGSAHFTVAPLDRTKYVPPYDFTDLWWNPSESGWGMTITQHASTNMVVTWFVYGPDGKPTWFAVLGGIWQGNAFTGAVYKTSGPYFGGVFDPSKVSVIPAGTAYVNFKDFSHGGFTYTIDGVTVSKQIERQPF